MGVDKRLSVFEDYIKEEVRSRMDQDIETILYLLERDLSREEFKKVARIIYQCEIRND
jgi:hypothetical protein